MTTVVEPRAGRRDRMRRPGVIAGAFLLAAAVTAGSQGLLDGISVRGAAEAVVPLFDDASFYATGYGGSLTADIALLPFLSAFFQAGALVEPVKGLDALSIMSAGLGAGLTAEPIERLLLRLDVLGGWYNGTWAQTVVGNAFLGARGGLGFRISPALSLTAQGGLACYLGKSSPLLTAASAGIGLTLHPGAIGSGSARVRLEGAQAESLFPIFYYSYGERPFGSVTLVNGESASIRDVRVSLSVGEYMSQPSLCATLPSVAAGSTAQVPLRAIFNDQVLCLTEDSRVPAEVIVDYTLLGSPRSSRESLALRFHHRNAMTWGDDRKAAAFVSPTDPAAIWFARFVVSVVRDRLRPAVNRNLQLAMGLFEAERLYGIAYVVDPNSAYAAKSALGDDVDYLQYPHQTLVYRGGDCDDLSILYCALLESVGVRTAFITIPGHIYMAFALDMTEKEARASFFDPGILIYRDGQAWVPVEITLVQEGFVKAWRIGAKEWADNQKAGKARFYPMDASWREYAAVGIPDVNPRFTLPEQAPAAQAFDDAFNRFAAKEIDPSVRKLREQIAAGGLPEAVNELGILYGRYGMLIEARTQFSELARKGRPWALANLGSVAFLRREYKTALSWYTMALERDPGSMEALLGQARCLYEMEDFTASEKAYTALKARDPDTAERYGYLASMFGGRGRAWTFSERLMTTVWSRPPAPAPAVAMEPPAAPKPAAEPTPAPKPEPAPAPAVAMAPPAAPKPAAEPAPAPKPATEPAPPIETPAAAAELPAVPQEPRAEEASSAEAVQEAPAEAPAAVEAVPEDLAAQPIAAAPALEEQPAQAAPAEALPAAEAPAVAAPAPAEDYASQVDAALAAEELAMAEAAVAELPPATAPEPVPAPAQASQAAAPETAPAAAAPVGQPAAEPPAESAPIVAEASAEQPAAEPEAEAAAPQDVPAPGPAQDLEEAAVPAEVEAAPREQPAVEPAVVAIAVEQTPAPAPSEEPVMAAAPPEQTTEPQPAAPEPAAREPAPEPRILREGFGGAFAATGRWIVEDTAARQTDRQSLWAKLVCRVEQQGRPLRYTFTARSTGKGWVGYGVHVLSRTGRTHRGYGEGSSLLVWLTRDPARFGDGGTRLQVYRSETDSRMGLVGAAVIPDSVFTPADIRLDVDPAAGLLSVFVGGVLRFSGSGFQGLEGGQEAVLRSLDTAEFRAFRVEELP